jgi:AcrR family transcriptional regulator
MKPPIKFSETKKLLTRKKIEAVARKIFLKKGYPNTTMDEIAEKAGISKGAVYCHFKNKNDLFISQILPAANKLKKRFEDFEKRLPRFKNSREVIGEYFKIHQEVYSPNIDKVKILQTLQQKEIFSGLSAEELKKFTVPTRANFEASRRIILKAQQQGVLAKVDEFQLADVLWGSFLGITQVEESKRMLSHKDHTSSTLDFLSTLLSKALDGKGN